MDVMQHLPIYSISLPVAHPALLQEKTAAVTSPCGRPLYLIVNEHDAFPLNPLVLYGLDLAFSTY